MIETRTIKAPKFRGRKASRNERAQAAAEQDARTFARWKRAEARAERAKRHITTRSDGVTRCSKCPPKHCCPDCARINNGRQIAGLIRPRGSPEPHPNNCLWRLPPPNHRGRKPDRRPDSASAIISIEVVALGGGWYLGQAFLGRQCVYEKKFRSRDEARRYAVNAMVCIREGQRYEASLNG